MGGRNRSICRRGIRTRNATTARARRLNGKLYADNRATINGRVYGRVAKDRFKVGNGEPAAPVANDNAPSLYGLTQADNAAESDGKAGAR